MRKIEMFHKTLQKYKVLDYTPCKNKKFKDIVQLLQMSGENT